MTGFFSSPTITFGSYTLIKNGDINIFIVKYDPSGNVIWAKSACGTNEDAAWSIASDASENAYVTGSFGSPTISFGQDTLFLTGGSDVFLAKSDGYNVGIDDLHNSANISVYPDPADENLVIEIKTGVLESSVSVINLEGQELIQQKVTESKISLDISSLPVGVYFVKVTGEHTVQVKKFIKD